MPSNLYKAYRILLALGEKKKTATGKALGSEPVAVTPAPHKGEHNDSTTHESPPQTIGGDNDTPG